MIRLRIIKPSNDKSVEKLIFNALVDTVEGQGKVTELVANLRKDST